MNIVFNPASSLCLNIYSLLFLWLKVLHRPTDLNKVQSMLANYIDLLLHFTKFCLDKIKIPTFILSWFRVMYEK